MARTLKGNLTGRAAQLQRIDDAQDPAPTARDECAATMAELKQLDPIGWEGWYDANVVEANNWRGITEQVKARIDFINEFCAEIEAQAADARDLMATQESARF